ncbi:ATP-binding protein [Conexibacter sp. JD483]|uniref:sensor histidine kinase n=1 Tax=unclassified Conexibacter TaxID=2627773 RepID=UPI002723F085|nr:MULTISPECIES: ATP-binding protein [unclassified Conexibacter]MDO8184174.1 ATP-binding protein [Conexibacter sp. CPCC 205706]MDO8197166.1 ATP-binding protein [Conexibacter sp. CPCC 205762]MDR9367519.1 ATP-binding protein [Conexibacter sp. JD483]
MSDQPRGRLVSRLTVSQWFTWAAIAMAAVAAMGIVLGILAITRLTDARTLVVGKNGPALTASLQLSNALINQETGVRGYAIGGRDDYLGPWEDGLDEARDALRTLHEITTIEEHARVRELLREVERRVDAWQTRYARPTIAAVQDRGVNARDKPDPEEGRILFDAIRRAMAAEQAEMTAVRNAGRGQLTSAANSLTYTFVAIALLFVLGIIGVVVSLRAVVTRPLQGVSRQVRRTARGDFEHEIAGGGPRDIVDLGDDVDTMRRRIVEELASIQEAHRRLDQQTRELQRSNTELEQFAYVASHDLQEPLRKVASFCQLLEKRYKGQLDERGDQYIEFAVDGAKRMQQLINDLLSFSRVGRVTTELEVVELDDVLRHALTSLAAAIEESGAEVVVPESLPPVRGEASLLAGVFQNLVGNALKFRSRDVPPRIEVAIARVGDEWQFAVTDNGIGIEPDYAERIFMIFQRLHPKDVYAGTGIGLAMCRKIIEYHGGRIWLDTDAGAGTTFRFTLPALQEDE